MKSFLKNLILVSAFLPMLNTLSQSLTQNIKGIILDNDSQTPLFGASVLVVGTNPLLGGITNVDGSFRINNVPVGRYDIKVTYVGYDDLVIPGIQINTGKEIVLNYGMKQSVIQMKEVVISGYSRKDQPQNNMAMISARTFSVEETRRYAGGLDDPARMASAFAGVTVGNLQDNAIVIRGNSPKGVAWHLEGIDIPNPNHFAGGNVAGGGFVTIFSSQMLANSDFYTGAFPAEYGNAVAGVFDMKLRNGNNDKREHTIQVGVLGIDVSSEGPFVKGKKASYLFNYRYSTWGLLTTLGIIPTAQVPRYQDLSFKLNFPTAKAGTFSVWGIGGMDKLFQPYIKDSSKWESSWDRIQMNWTLNTGAAGVSHKISVGQNSFINTTLAASGTYNNLDQKMISNNMALVPNSFLTDQSKKIEFNTYLKHKFSARHTVKAGVDFKELFFNLDLNGVANNDPSTFKNYIKQNGHSYYSEVYVSSKYALTNSLMLISGINACYFNLTNHHSIDPRVALRWEAAANHAFTIGYGKHSQLEELRIYFIKQNINGETSYPNKSLSLAHSQHLVLGYDWLINNNLRLKVEPYFQYLYNVPGIADSSWSMINFKQDWAFQDALVNNSRGRNIGVDVTFERFLNNNYYYLVTTSIFDSRYQGGDGVWRNTRYNKSFVINLLAGKEFYLRNNHVLGINGRLNIMGGERYSPVNLDQSLLIRTVVYDEKKAFSRSAPKMYYLDMTLTWRTNKKKFSSIWAVQVKNILGSPLYEGEYYNYRSNSVKSSQTVVVVPIISYKVEF
jgi:hypothetical protein